MSKNHRQMRACLAFQEKIAYTFKDPDLLIRAFTHVSAGAELGLLDNERLEFLGDKVLGIVVAELLYAQYPLACEGELSRWFNARVRRGTVGWVALLLGGVVVVRFTSGL